MKVLHLLSWYAERPGGTDGPLFRKISEALEKQGVASDMLYASMDLRRWPEKIRFGRKGLWLSTMEEPPVYRYYSLFPPKKLPLFLDHWEKRFLSIMNRYFALAGKPDIIHAHVYWAGLAAQRISKQFDIPFIVTEHSRLPTAAWLRNRMTRMYKAATVVTCVSERLKEDIENLGEIRAEVISNFYDPALFFPRVKPKTNAVRFLSIGSPAWIKGYDLLLPAFKGLLETGRDHAVLLLGDKIKGARSLRRQLKVLKIEEKVSFLGAMPLEKVPEQMQKADIYISASRFETFGTTIIEALACGLPIVATRTYGPTSFLRPQHGILVPVGNLEQLTDALIWMYDHHQEYDPQVLSESVRQDFSSEVVIPQYVKLYQEILSNRDRRT